MINLDDTWENICKSKETWLAWCFLAENNDKEMYKYWTTLEGCCFDGIYCDQLDKKNAWCELQELPCRVNPFLTIKHGIIGMACMGAYEGIYEQKIKEIENE